MESWKNLYRDTGNILKRDFPSYFTDPPFKITKINNYNDHYFVIDVRKKGYHIIKNYHFWVDKEDSMLHYIYAKNMPGLNIRFGDDNKILASGTYPGIPMNTVAAL